VRRLLAWIPRPRLSGTWRAILTALAILGVFQTVIGIPSMPDDLSRWPPLLADLGEGAGALQRLFAPFAGDLARIGILLAACLLLVVTNLPREAPPPEPVPHRRRVGKFAPSTHGFKFGNAFESGPTIEFGPLDPRSLGFGDASAGLAGGMTAYVRERYESGQPIPPDEVAPAPGTPLFRRLVRRQVQSLRWFRTPLRILAASRLSKGRAIEAARERELPAIRRQIDAGRLADVCVLHSSGSSPGAMTKRTSQVLAYGYEEQDGATLVNVYDPNWPTRDDIVIEVNQRSILLSTGRPVHAVICLD
jgi:hypothetical protein